MRVSPLDIRKQNFKKVMRGADPEEVRMFLDVVASEYEKVIQDNAMMGERIRTLDARLAEFRALEENMRNSLVMADRIATESRESSDREARRIIQDAHSRSERILEDARERLQILVREIEALRGKKEVFARRFWTMIEGQIGVLQEHMADTVEVDSLRQRVSQMASDAQAAAEAAAAEPEPRPAPPPRSAPRPEAEVAVPVRGEAERPNPYWPGPDATATAAAAAAPSSPPIPAPVEPAPRLPIPRGLGRLLRGRQASLPLNEPAPAATEAVRPRPLPAEENLPEPERAEGFFEISASEARRREGGPWFREDETGDRG